jgi:hypothetical protein
LVRKAARRVTLGPGRVTEMRRPERSRDGRWVNAPFGALCPLDPAHDVDALTSRIADFFVRSRREL